MSESSDITFSNPFEFAEASSSSFNRFESSSDKEQSVGQSKVLQELLSSLLLEVSEGKANSNSNKSQCGSQAMEEQLHNTVLPPFGATLLPAVSDFTNLCVTEISSERQQHRKHEQHENKNNNTITTNNHNSNNKEGVNNAFCSGATCQRTDNICNIINNSNNNEKDDEGVKLVDKVIKEHNPMVRRNVYINGLPNYFRSNDLRELCKVYGPIEASKLCASHHGPTAKSYGFVLFYTEEDAEQCITQLDGSRLCGQRLQARYADSKATPLPSHPSSLQATRLSSSSMGVEGANTHDQWLVSSGLPSSHAPINTTGDGEQLHLDTTERMNNNNTKVNNKYISTTEAEVEKVKDYKGGEYVEEEEEEYEERDCFAFPMQRQAFQFSRGNSPDLVLPTQELKKGYRLANILRNSHNKRGLTHECTVQRSPLFEGVHSVFPQTGSATQSCPSTPHHLENRQKFISRATLSPSPPPTLTLPAATSSFPQNKSHFPLENENDSNVPRGQVRRGSVQSFHGSARNSPVPHIITQQSPESHSLHVRSPIVQSLQVQYKEPHTTRNYKTLPLASSAYTELPNAASAGVSITTNNNNVMNANTLSASANSTSLNNNTNNNQNKRTSSPPNSSDLHEFITLHAQTPNHLQMLHQNTNPTKNNNNISEVTISPLSTLPSSTATAGPMLTQTTPVINNVHNNAIMEALMLHAQQAITQRNTTSNSTENKEVKDTNNNTVRSENNNSNNNNEPTLAVSNTQTNTNPPMTSPLLSQYVYVPINLALLASLQSQLQESSSSSSTSSASLINPLTSLVLSSNSTSLPAAYTDVNSTSVSSTNTSANDTERCNNEGVNLTSLLTANITDNNNNNSISNNSTTANVNVNECTNAMNATYKGFAFNVPEAANASTSSSAYAPLFALSLPPFASSVLPTTSAPSLSQSSANTTNVPTALPIIMIDPTTGAAFASLNPLSQ